VFYTDTGYHRSGESEEIAMKDLEAYEPVTFIINDYVYQSIASTIHSMFLTKEIPVRNLNVVLQYDGSKHNLTLKNDEGVFRINAEVNATIPILEAAFLLRLDLEVTFIILPGDNEYFAYLQPYLDPDSIKYKILKYYLEGMEIKSLNIEPQIEEHLIAATKKFKVSCP